MTLSARILEGFAGPGGFSEAARMVGLDRASGIELGADACATARAAGHTRICVDIRDLDADAYPHARGWVSGPPCPPWSAAGLHAGRTDYGTVLTFAATVGNSTVIPTGDPAANTYQAAYTAAQDARSALILETLKLALWLPNLEWIVAEQVPAVERIWWDFAAELASARWESCNVIALRADDFGLPTRRTRVFLVAARRFTPDFTGIPIRSWWRTGKHEEPWTPAPQMWTPFPRLSMADALGWPADVRVNTRGDRRTPGGNVFSADGPAPGLTHSARSWYRTDLGKPDGELAAWQAGLLQGFPADYPWCGSRSSQFQQIADSVPPLMGAAVLGAVTGRPWQKPVWDRIEAQYARRPAGGVRMCGTGRERPGQPDLFGDAA